MDSTHIKHNVSVSIRTFDIGADPDESGRLFLFELCNTIGCSERMRDYKVSKLRISVIDKDNSSYVLELLRLIRTDDLATL
jgi:hypothetical protein